jgi:hypothetical protein
MDGFGENMVDVSKGNMQNFAFTVSAFFTGFQLNGSPNSREFIFCHQSVRNRLA